MKQVIVSEGKVSLADVPAPAPQPGAVLVRMHHSCVSVGTEMSGVQATGRSVLQRVLDQPKNVQKVIDLVRSDGLSSAVNLVRERLSVELPTGYSGAGTVIELGAGVTEFRIGDRIACAGAQSAFHAQFVSIPVNLTARIPDNVDFAAASTVALGAIALQGIRRAAPTLGEIFVVVGLGFIGQLTVQMLRANGCRVIGVDVDRDRIAAAKEAGLDWSVHPEDGDTVDQVIRLTAAGADGVIVTAASPSDEIVSTAFRMCRRKARVVLVGDVGLDLNRADFYAKELDFLISTSYGPGRYDDRYEDKGLDYPIGYVRWTEGRNMAEYLRLISDGLVDLGKLPSVIHPLEKVSDAYGATQAGGATKPLLVLLSYSQDAKVTPDRRLATPAIATKRAVDRVRLAVIGAGGFAKGMHLPNIAEMADLFHLRAVASRTGHNAALTAKRFGADYSTTDYHQVLDDPEVDAVIIATRHDTHSAVAIEALQAGKHVLLEKPLALTEAETAGIEDFYETNQRAPLLLTGFNRRFSPIMESVSKTLASRSNPMIINYRMNAGYIPLDHWVHGPEGGGRNRGEACHIYDLFTFLTQAEVTSVEAISISPTTAHYSPSDNFVATMQFKDGSVATLTYTALGSSAYSKETMEIFAEGSVYNMDDYRTLNIVGQRNETLDLRKADKGQKNQLRRFADAIRLGREWPSPLWQQAQATRIAIAVDARI
ncbi:bi-domain-containing oxidoreductase [Devosia beringensis]|uniref:bi-domain-containing oxidoreductase n=1 Tax=Devosia beringensis TaxID=2657486 RepID=UPI00186B814C|nr:bi-domain-containing oxidoreductase [Devosia beringensis]